MRTLRQRCGIILPRVMQTVRIEKELEFMHLGHCPLWRWRPISTVRMGSPNPSSVRRLTLAQVVSRASRFEQESPLFYQDHGILLHQQQC